MSLFSGEIDKCLKKVAEGVEAFEETWQKVRECVSTFVFTILY